MQNIVKYNSLEEVEMVVKMGVEEGMYSTLSRLDELLDKFNQAK